MGEMLVGEPDEEYIVIQCTPFNFDTGLTFFKKNFLVLFIWGPVTQTFIPNQNLINLIPFRFILG